MSIIAIKLLDRSGQRAPSATLLLEQQAPGSSADAKNEAALGNICYLLKVDRDTAQKVELYAAAAAAETHDIQIKRSWVADATELTAMAARSPGLFTEVDGYLTLWYSLPSTATDQQTKQHGTKRPLPDEPAASAQQQPPKKKPKTPATSKQQQQSSCCSNKRGCEDDPAAVEPAQEPAQKKPKPSSDPDGAYSYATGQMHNFADEMTPRHKSGAFKELNDKFEKNWRDAVVEATLRWAKKNNRPAPSKQRLSTQLAE
jgi:hypothetical protein